MPAYLRTNPAGVAVERIFVPDGLTLADMLHPDLAAACHVQAAAQIGDTWDPDTENWKAAPPLQAPPVPDISRAQARIQLHRAGLLQAAEDAVRAAGGEVAIWYADAATWQRANPYVAQIGGALSPKLSDAEIDDLFRAAALIGA